MMSGKPRPVWLSSHFLQQNNQKTRRGGLPDALAMQGTVAPEAGKL
jgi:hypothetical protein